MNSVIDLFVLYQIFIVEFQILCVKGEENNSEQVLKVLIIRQNSAKSENKLIMKSKHNHYVVKVSA